MAGSTQTHTLTDALMLYADGQMAADELAAFVGQYDFKPIVDGGGFPQRGTVQEVSSYWLADLMPNEDYERVLDAIEPAAAPMQDRMAAEPALLPEAKALHHAVRYNPRARDADRDRIVQEGTPFERPALPLPEAWQNPFEHLDRGTRRRHEPDRPSLFSGAGGKPNISGREDEKKPAPPKRTDKQKKAEADARRTVQFWFADHPGEGLAGYYVANPYGFYTGDAEYDEAFNDAVLEYDREIGRSKPETWGKRNIEDTGMPRSPLAVMSAGTDTATDPAQAASERAAAAAAAQEDLWRPPPEATPEPGHSFNHAEYEKKLIDQMRAIKVSPAKAAAIADQLSILRERYGDGAKINIIDSIDGYFPAAYDGGEVEAAALGLAHIGIVPRIINHGGERDARWVVSHEVGHNINEYANGHMDAQSQAFKAAREAGEDMRNRKAPKASRRKDYALGKRNEFWAEVFAAAQFPGSQPWVYAYGDAMEKAYAETKDLFDDFEAMAEQGLDSDEPIAPWCGNQYL